MRVTRSCRWMGGECENGDEHESRMLAKERMSVTEHDGRTLGDVLRAMWWKEGTSRRIARGGVMEQTVTSQRVLQAR
eukprot:3111888-Rhodomonas_salina.2